MITEKTTKKEMTEFPSNVLCTLYAVAMFHEKYIFAKWITEILATRGIDKSILITFDENFRGFYENLLNQDDL